MAAALTQPDRMLSRWLAHAWSQTLSEASELFSDVGVRAGIKFALAGTISLYFALLLRLEEPTWALTTALVLSTPKFVGAIAEKTILRIVGALLGAGIGYVITGSLQQNPILFLGAIGGLVAFTSAMFGGTFVPYGFRQAGYTATLVAAQGLADPAFSWKVGMARCEEILVGICVTTLIISLVWPRYARTEFVSGVRGVLMALRDLFELQTRGVLSGQTQDPNDVYGRIGGRLAKLRGMIRLGCMESRAFRERQPEVNDIVSQLGILGTAISGLGQSLPSQSLFRSFLGPRIKALHAAFSDALATLANPKADAAARQASVAAARACLNAYEADILELRNNPAREGIPADEALDFGGYSLSIREICDALERLSDLAGEMHAGQLESLPVLHVRRFTMPSGEWIKSGIRAGFCVVLGLLILDWLHPPGGDILVVGTYLFTGFSLESPDRKGDLGVFNILILTAFGCMAFFLFLLIAIPFMSSYEGLNLVLATVLFLIGYLGEKTSMSGFVSLILLLLVVNIVGINAQAAVPFESIVGAALGLFLATAVSAVVRRLIWPSLPQNELHRRLLGILALLENALAHPQVTMPVPARAEFALSVADALELVRVLEKNVLSPDDALALRKYIESLGRLGGHMIPVLGHESSGIPSDVRDEHTRQVEQLCQSLRLALEKQRDAIARKERLAATFEPNAAFSRWAAVCRLSIREKRLPVPHALAELGALYRLSQAESDLQDSAQSASDSHFERAFADSRL